MLWKHPQKKQKPKLRLITPKERKHLTRDIYSDELIDLYRMPKPRGRGRSNKYSKLGRSASAK